MAQTLASAGFVITNDTAIWATGTTADAAWAMFESETGFADVDAKAEDEGVTLTDAERFERRREGFECHSASAALLAEVDARGGAISWDHVGRVACTVTEGEDAREAA